MDINNLNIRIQTMQNLIKRIDNASSALLLLDKLKYPKQFQELSLDTAVKTEMLACQARELVGSYGLIPPANLMAKLSDAQKIRIEYTDNAYFIRISKLLPKWKRNRSGDFLTLPLSYALEEFCKQNNIRKFSECAICFIHVYDKNLSLDRVRDYDNLEMKHVLDTITAYLMTDDSGRLCDKYETTEYAEADGTLIYVMPKNDLPKFLSDRNPVSKNRDFFK